MIFTLFSNCFKIFYKLFYYPDKYEFFQNFWFSVALLICSPIIFSIKNNKNWTIEIHIYHIGRFLQNVKIVYRF